jgi:RNA 2',3'-cyclic 3'-phosphodiesterase
MQSPTVRLFIALWPTDTVRQAIAQWQSEWQWPERAALVAGAKLHLTLHFVGDVEPRRVLDLKYVLKSVPAPRFDLHFGRPEIWSHGIAVLRPAQSPTVLRGLQARIGLALASIDLPSAEQTFRPHVTLARRAAAAKPPGRMPDITWQARTGFVLVQAPGGARAYEIVERFGA